MKDNYRINNQTNEITCDIVAWEAERGRINLSGTAFKFISNLKAFDKPSEVKICVNGEPSNQAFCFSNKGNYYQIYAKESKSREKGDLVTFRFDCPNKTIHITL